MASIASSQYGFTHYDVVIIGAGVGGLYAVHKLREQGFRVRAFEAGDGVGGTWFWNRYPGARCDVESLQYSYSFSHELQQEWNWTERYAGQPEILAYLEHVAERFDLKRDIQFSTRIKQAAYDESAHRWTLTTDAGEQVSGAFCVMAMGNLSVPRVTPLPGQEDFAGDVYYTAQWPKEGVDFTGRRVGVVGTGASGMQSVPPIAEEAEQLYVFQRTPNFSVPAWNGPLPAEEQAAWKADYAERRRLQAASKAGMIYPANPASALAANDEDREAMFARHWEFGSFAFMQAFNDLSSNKEANDHAVAYVHGRIGATVKDPSTAAALMPRDHAIGARRVCTQTGFYDAFNRDNVALVDVKADPIVRIVADGIETRGAHYKLDTLVMATGFEAMTGALTKLDIRGRGNRSLRDAWADGPVGYLGLAVTGFPNMFTLTGPHSPSTLVSLVMGNEQHVDWVANLLTWAREHGVDEVEAQGDAQDAWVEDVQALARGSLKMDVPSSNYIYEAPSGKRTFMVYLGGFDRYSAICEAVAAEGYRGFDRHMAHAGVAVA